MMKKMHETIMLAIMKAYFNYFDYETNDFFNDDSYALQKMPPDKFHIQMIVSFSFKTD